MKPSISYFNISISGTQAAVGTPVNVRFYPDVDFPRAEYNGYVHEQGRLFVVHEIPFGVGGNLEVIAPGCKSWGPVHGLVGSEFVQGDGSPINVELEPGDNPFRSKPSLPPILNRPPIVYPKCHSCPSEYSYDKTLPEIPSWPDRSYMRANCWSVPIQGLPWLQGRIEGTSSRHPERYMSYFHGLYPDEFRSEWTRECLARRYSHFVMSLPNDMSNAGASLDDCIRMYGELKSRGAPFVGCFLRSKVYNPHDRTGQQQIDEVAHYVKALIDAKVVDEIFPSWEHDLWNIPGKDTIDYFRWVGTQAHNAGIGCWIHFSTHVTSWFADGDPRGRDGFWDDLGDTVDGILYQGDPAWDIGELQSRMVDTTSHFARQRWGHKMRAFELVAMDQFDNDHPDEAEADSFGFLASCTKTPGHDDHIIMGYGNGGKDVDGMPL